MEPSWRQEAGPAGFYNLEQHIVVLPNVFPRPSVIIDHEITHVSVINSSAIGLIQQVAACLRHLGRELEDSSIIGKADNIASLMSRHTVAVHESIAWFGTELTTMGLESVRAPEQYREGVSRILRALVSISNRSASAEELTFTDIMTIADGVGSYALSPPVVADHLAEGAELNARRIDRDLRKNDNNPLKRFERLCADVSSFSFSEALEWARTVLGEGGDIKPATAIAPTRRKFWALRKVVPVRYYKRPPAESELIPNIIRSYCRRGITVQQASSAWSDHGKLFRYSPSIDRYAQCCLSERAVLRFVQPIDGPKAIDFLLEQPWLRVRATEAGYYDTNYVRVADGRIIIGAGPDYENVSTFMRMETELARYFLGGYHVLGGRGIVASSVHYDLGTGDYEGLHILKETPHAVMSITDLKSLWIKFAILKDTGLAGDRCIEWMLSPSQMWPDEFGYLMLKPQSKPYPIVIMPILIRNFDRALSVVNFLPSPWGTEIRPRTTPYKDWIDGCRHSVADAISAFDLNLKQPEELITQFMKMRNAPRVSLTPRQALHRMAQR